MPVLTSKDSTLLNLEKILLQMSTAGGPHLHVQQTLGREDQEPARELALRQARRQEEGQDLLRAHQDAHGPRADPGEGQAPRLPQQVIIMNYL